MSEPSCASNKVPVDGDIPVALVVVPVAAVVALLDVVDGIGVELFSI